MLKKNILYPQLTTTLKKENWITRMTNSRLYYLDFVFILKEHTGFRLIIRKQDKLHDLVYTTLRGAKVGCAHFIRKSLLEGGLKLTLLKLSWSFFYPVDENWLQDKLKES